MPDPVAPQKASIRRGTPSSLILRDASTHSHQFLFPTSAIRIATRRHACIINIHIHRMHAMQEWCWLFGSHQSCALVWRRMCELMPGVCQDQHGVVPVAAIANATTAAYTQQASIPTPDTSPITSIDIECEPIATKPTCYHRVLQFLWPLPTSKHASSPPPPASLTTHLHRAGHRMWRLPIMLDLVGDRVRSRALSCCIFLAIFCFAVYFGM